MDSFTLVRTEHLNQYNNLFGGQLLKWVDEYAWLFAARDFPDRRLVTRAMDNSEFKHSVPNGSILRFSVKQERVGNTSVTYVVDVYSDEPGGEREKHIFSNKVTFVSVDEHGNKRSLSESTKGI